MLAPTILRRESSETTNALTYALSPDAAVILMADGSARILDMGDRFYSVPSVAAIFLRETLQNGPGSAVERVVAEYDVDQSQVEADLGAFLGSLVERGVLECHNQTSMEKTEHLSALPLISVALTRIISILPSLCAKAFVLLTGVRILISLFGWPRTVSTLRREFATCPDCLSSDEPEALAREIDQAVCSAAARNPFGVACKERALTCWALARKSGLPAALVIGIELYPLSGHCWCECGSLILSDHADNCTNYLSVLRYQ